MENNTDLQQQQHPRQRKTTTTTPSNGSGNRHQQGGGKPKTTTTRHINGQQQQQQPTTNGNTQNQDPNNLSIGNGTPPTPPPPSAFPPPSQPNHHLFNRHQMPIDGNGFLMPQTADAMQAFTNLGLFQQQQQHQFPAGILQPVIAPSSTTVCALPPHLAAAAVYGQRLMSNNAGVVQQHQSMVGQQLHPNGNNNNSNGCCAMPPFVPNGTSARKNVPVLPSPASGNHHQHQQHPSASSSSSSSSAPPTAAAPSTPSTHSSSSSINRSQRCGVCRGCQCKPCGQCTYCQDSPQFGGPGVKKQSCIERRCLRVLENRLQRDSPTFKARIGCNLCEDCRSADCQICLVCLDKRFFNSKFMAGAMCAKKRCNNATALELPIYQNNNHDRTSLKRHSDCGSTGNGCHQQQQQGAKRQVPLPPQQATTAAANQLNSNIARILSAAAANNNDGQPTMSVLFDDHNLQQHQKFGGPMVGGGGRCSGGDSTSSTNSPLSETGANTGGAIHSPLLGGGGVVYHHQTQSAAATAGGLFGRPFWAGPPAQMLGVLPPPIAGSTTQLGQYVTSSPFNQMASLAAAAAVGFPQQQQMAPAAVAYTIPSYQPKFLNYPKYEYFTAAEEQNTALIVNNASTALETVGDDGQIVGMQNGGVGGGHATENLLVPPSYSDVQKVVLQPL